jgi:exopolysaccharide production protein ExoZ
VSTPSGRYTALDGIRFYSALLVFLVHGIGAIALDIFRIREADFTPQSSDIAYAFWSTLANFGHHGVDIFFILSGFLMMKVSFDDNKLIGSARFLFRRILRIYPAFAASLILGAWIRVQILDWDFNLEDFLLNFLFLNAIPELGIVPYNFVTWSLGYEFAFYLLVPLIFLAPAGRSRILLVMGLIGLGFLVIPDTYLRFLGLLFGALLGCLSDEDNRRISDRFPVSLLVAAYFASSLAHILGAVNIYVYLAVFLPVTCLLIAKISFHKNALNQIFSLPFLSFLGKISYSFYLWHTICISLVYRYVIYSYTQNYNPGPFGSIYYFSLSLVLSILVAYVSYVLFERWYFAMRRPGQTARVPG